MRSHRHADAERNQPQPVQTMPPGSVAWFEAQKKKG
jgi:hypothetical protein